MEKCFLLDSFQQNARDLFLFLPAVKITFTLLNRDSQNTNKQILFWYLVVKEEESNMFKGQQYQWFKKKCDIMKKRINGKQRTSKH